jgi:PKD repeat protein
MHIHLSSPARLGRRLATAILFTAIAALAVTVGRAHATDGNQYSLGQYGETTRWGGFDTTWFDEGTDTGKSGGSAGTDPAPTAGRFLNPVGFTVDTNDEATGASAVYVLERVSGLASQVGAQGTEWRLQKLNAGGTQLASSLFYLPADVVSGAHYSVFVGVVGLAVDDSTGTLYSMLYDTAGTGAQATRQVAEVIDWSTKPIGNQLVAPTGASTTDSAGTTITPASGSSHPGVLSTATQLTSTPLYEPEGLALDVTGGQDYLAIEANANDTRNGSGSFTGGPAIVQQIATSGAQAGDEAASWSAANLTTPSLVANASSEDATALAAGISTKPDGSLDVLLATAAEVNSWGDDDVALPANLTGPTVVDSAALNPSYPTPEYAEAGSDDNPDAIPVSDGPLAGQLSTTGTGGSSAQVVGLTNGLSASYSNFSTNGFGYWGAESNEGIRLVEPEAEGLLSNPLDPVTSIYDTLGNATPGTPGGACSIGNTSHANNDVTLAAGANGTVWALVAGEDDSIGNGPEYVTGREVIEYAPGAAKQCAGPGPTGATFTVAPEHGTPQPASTPLKVTAGSTVDFDAAPIEYPPANKEKPAGIYAYEWAPTGATNGYTIVKDTVGENGNLETESDFAPEAQASYTYNSPGVYPVALKLLGDFGEYDETGSIVVQTTSPPTAAFTGPAEAQAGQSVSFNASASKEAAGAHIVDYRWNFGDGQSDETQSATDTHVYSSTGSHTVTLTIRDNDNQESAAVSQKITITSPPAAKTGTGTTTTTTTTPTTTTPAPSPPPVAQIDRSATNVSPKALEKNGEVEVTLTCPATKVSCAGTVEVKTATAVAARVAKKGKAKKSVLVLGQATFSLAGGQRETLTVKLSAKGAALLKKSKRLKADVLVAAHDSYGDPGSQTLGLTLTEPAKKSAKKK